jgi:hypothetical protein
MIYHRMADGQYQCPECQVIKRLQSTMHYHMKTHLQEAHHTCPHCAKTFLQKRTMDVHIATKHAPVRTLSCPLCTYSTAGKGNLIIHCFRAHFKDEVRALAAGKKLTECGACHATFGSSTSFYYHAKGCLPPSAKLESVRGIL